VLETLKINKYIRPVALTNNFKCLCFS